VALFTFFFVLWWIHLSFKSSRLQSLNHRDENEFISSCVSQRFLSLFFIFETAIFVVCGGGRKFSGSYIFLLFFLSCGGFI